MIEKEWEEWEEIIPPEDGRIHMNRNGAVLMSINTYFDIVLAHKEVAIPKKWIDRWMNKDVREKILDNMLLPETFKDMIRKDMEEGEK